MEQWKISRGGLLNFWYYDDETFEFQDGRLLLRGSNGSGKSVTMQSFVPLLLDGNRRPERLDPFGTSARKMENYIIGEEYGVEERISYLFLEFSKKEQKQYKTIGMGLRGRKNKPLETWYFILEDQRRVGKDFYLYKNMGGKMTLTRKELENRLGEGGRVYKTQKEYMAAVNQSLFGYENVEDYDELIKLLVQLRSPKLSKDFKPTVIYEIMSNALQTLTDEDLRPMSEAIENMDTVKSQLEALKKTKKGVEKITKSYDRYNRYVLLRKGDEYLQSRRDHLQSQKRLKELEQSIASLSQQIEEAIEKEQELKEESYTLKKKKETLEKNDLFKLQQRMEEIEVELTEMAKQLLQKQQYLDDVRSKERETKGRVDEIKSDLELSRDELEELLEEMDPLSESSAFDEHSFMKGEISKALGEPYDFTFIKEELGRYKRVLQECYGLLKEEGRLKRDYDDAKYKVDQVQRQLDDQESKLHQAEVYFDELIEEYIEKLYEWKESNKIYHLSDGKFNTILAIVRQYGVQSTFEDFYQELRVIYLAQDQEFYQQIWELEQKGSTFEEKIMLLEKEKEEWLNKKTATPPSHEEVRHTMMELSDKNIKFTPLYKAIDFKANLDEAQRNAIESALVELGLLDALIIGEEDQAVLTKTAEKGLVGSFLDASKVESMGQETASLRQYFDLEEDIEDTLKIRVNEVLEAIKIHESELFHVGPDGRYGMGLIEGQAPRVYEAKYIGVKAQERYRLKQIKGIEQEINELVGQKEVVDQCIKEIKIKNNQLKMEFESIPKEHDIKEGHRLLKEAEVLRERWSYEKAVVEKRAQEIWSSLQIIREELRQKADKILLSLDLGIYKEAIEDLETYLKLLHDFELKHSRYHHRLGELESAKEYYEDLLVRLDDLMVDLRNLERKTKGLEEQKSLFEEQLNKGGQEQLRAEFTACIKRLEELPEEQKEVFGYRNRQEVTLGNKEMEYQSEKQQSVVKIESYRLYKRNFMEECQLGYVVSLNDHEDKTADNQLLETAQGLLMEHNGLLQTSKDEQDYYADLIDKYKDSQGLLAEYQISFIRLFAEDMEHNPLLMKIFKQRLRYDLQVKIKGKNLSFKEFATYVADQITMNEQIFKEKDRLLFEDILLSTVSKKIKARIRHSQEWVAKMNHLMGQMNTSSGLSFNLQWKSRHAETEEQLGTKELVELLQMNAMLLTDEKKDKISNHFRSKIEEVRRRLDLEGYENTFLTVVKEVLDYRKWFEFQLYYTRKGERKKELTNNAFFTFSGGEKAMAMYVPLFSAVYARYDSARKDCPRIIALDEAFAGVDEKNIRDMFRLLVDLQLSFVMNSQVLWGDYDTVPSLSICDLLRPDNAKFVTVLRYEWNGKVKTMLDMRRGDLDAG